jgi:glycosyltransferase involved in cell wall biosynthesis
MNVVLLCLDSTVPFGGTHGRCAHLRGVATALIRAGHHVGALVTNPSNAELESLRAAEVAVTPVEPGISARTLAIRLGRERPELVLQRLTLGPQPGVQACQALDVPHVYLGDAVPGISGPPEDVHGRERAFTDLRAGLEGSNGAVVATHELIRWIKELAPPAFPVREVPRGVDRAFYVAPDPSAVARIVRLLGGGPAFRVGFFGSFRPWHDLTTLVEAMGRLGQSVRTQLVLVGDGPLRNTVLRSAWEHRASIHLAGTVPHALIPTYLAACDVVAVPYSSPDACFSPLKLLEAMAAARAVVASAIPPCSRLVRDGQSGMLVPPGDATSLHDSLRRLAGDIELRQRLGIAARAAVERHRWDDVAQGLLEFARVCGFKQSA